MTDSEKLDLLMKELVSMKQGFNEKIDSVQQELKQDIGAVRQELKQDIDSVKQELKQDIDSVRQEVLAMELTLENVTNKNIAIIAESHLDLSRNLHDVQSQVDEREKDLMRIRLNVLEDEVKRLKAREVQIA